MAWLRRTRCVLTNRTFLNYFSFVLDFVLFEHHQQLYNPIKPGKYTSNTHVFCFYQPESEYTYVIMDHSLSCTMVLLFKMFDHQMSVLPWSTPYYCFFSGRLLSPFINVVLIAFLTHLLLLLLISSSKSRLPAEKPSFQRTEIIS